MLSIKHEDWKKSCISIFTQKQGRKKVFLQWYPFSKLSYQDKNTIMSEKFFDEYIKTGMFLIQPENTTIMNNYMLKSDGNFRNATLVSPIMYILSIAIGRTISKKYQSSEETNINKFYAGNFSENRIYYKKDYDIFFKMLNNISKSYQYFIKTDVKDFFSNINVNKLFEMIENRLLETDNFISLKDLLIYRELLLFMGQGEFPLIENNTTSSYLATIIYLEELDNNLNKYITEHESGILDFQMVRYVDDLYIVFNLNDFDIALNPLVNRILGYYSSELKKINLSLNREKTSWRPISELNEVLKQSLYNDELDEDDSDISNLINDENVLKFIMDLKDKHSNFELDIKTYYDLINDNFTIAETEYMPQEVFNSLVYEEHNKFSDNKIKDIFFDLISLDYSFVKLDPKRLIVIILKTGDEKLIKLFLSKLFESKKKGIWDIYDTTLAINYLIQRNFSHKDLLEIIKTEEDLIYKYYEYFCRRSVIYLWEESEVSYIRLIFRKGYSKDDKLFFLYLMYTVEIDRKNYLVGYAYFKNYFDRISAHLDFIVNKDKEKKKPNYKGFYEEKILIELYKSIPDSDTIIKRAHKIRNKNPLSHASAELIDNDTTYKDILKSIEDLTLLVKCKVDEL